MAAKDTLYQVKESFLTTLGGQEVEYHVGEVVDADDPAVKKMPHMFGPLVFKHGVRGKAEKPEVEQATAAPGEKRGA